MKIKRGCLYTANLNPRFGTETGKVRPVIVIQNDLLNETGHPSTWVVPCTTQIAPSNILRVRFPEGCAGNTNNCDAMIDQSRAIDNRRFKKLLGVVPPILFDEIIEKIRHLGALQNY